MLDARAAVAPPEVSAARWKRDAKPPKPTLAQTKWPKRLLIGDLAMYLRPYTWDVDCTIVVMGDLNTDVISRTGCDNRALESMIDDLGLVSCAEARWPASSCVVKTRTRDKGNERRTGRHTSTTSSSRHTTRRRCGILASTPTGT